MPATYEPIASTTLGSAAADITFSSIPGTYTDLIVICQGSSTTNNSGARNLFMQVGASSIDTTTTYSNTILYGDGAGAFSYRESSVARVFIGDHLPAALSTNIKPGAYITHIMSYANTNVYKTILSASGGHVIVDRIVGLWRSTSAITTIKVYPNADNLASGFTASLYGIKAA